MLYTAIQQVAGDVSILIQSLWCEHTWPIWWFLSCDCDVIPWSMDFSCVFHAWFMFRIQMMPWNFHAWTMHQPNMCVSWDMPYISIIETYLPFITFWKVCLRLKHPSKILIIWSPKRDSCQCLITRHCWCKHQVAYLHNKNQDSSYQLYYWFGKHQVENHFQCFS